jgi:hypothetical protein
VTNLGAFSPVRTIQIVLTTALFPCRLMVASRRQCVSQGSTEIREAFAGACGFRQNLSQPRCVAALKVEGLAEYPSLVPTTRVRRTQAVVRDLADIQDGLTTVQQTRCHAGARTSCLVSFSEYMIGSYADEPSCPQNDSECWEI